MGVGLEPLGALDEAFLDLEAPDVPMHVGFVAVCEGGPFVDGDGRFRIEEVRARVESRLHLLPRLRRRLQPVPFGVGRPVWVDDAHFDVTDHVRHVALPPPGGDDALFELVSRLHMDRLDRTRPLWELWFVEGLAGGRVAVVEKIHHALVDGVADVDVAAVLADLSPDAPPVVAVPWSPEPGPSPALLLARSLRERAADPLAAARLLAGVGRVAGGLASLARRETIAPRSSLNRRVGGRRRYAVVREPLARTRAVREALGGTLNDVVLAAVAGGVRRLLVGRGEPCDGRELRVLVPVSTRPQHERGTLGNQVSAMLAPLPVGEPDALMRLRRVQAALRTLKEQHQADGTAFLLDLASHGAPALLSGVARLVHHQPFVNLVVTNVPGPDVPLYVMGARLLEVFPVVPLARNLDVSVGVLTYDGRLTMGLFADEGTCADVDVLAAGVAASFDELAALADGDAAGRLAGPARRGRRARAGGVGGRRVSEGAGRD